MTVQPDDMSGGPQPPRRSGNRVWLWVLGGCGGCGCLVIVLPIVALSYGASIFVQSFAAPDALEPEVVYDISDEELETARSTWNEQKGTFQAGETVTVTMGERELNALGALLRKQHEEVKVIETSIRDSKMDLRLSLEYKTDGGEKRYFNVEIKGGRMVFAPGEKELSAEEFRLGGQDWSGWLEPGSPIAQGIAEGMYDALFNDLRIKHGVEIRQVRVQDDRLHLELKKIEKPGQSRPPATSDGG